MTKKKLETKESIAEALLRAMQELDVAIAKMIRLDTDTDNANCNKMLQVKNTIKTTLQRNYDSLARKR